MLAFFTGMQQTDFLTAVSAVIPLLLLAWAIDLRVFTMPANSSTPFRLNVTLALGWVVGVSAWGEWICLRSLETGHLAGSTTVVWFALANLFGSVLIRLFTRIWF